MEERELIQRSKEGDLSSFNKLVEKYQRDVYNLALRMLGNVQAAEDIAQDTFISAFRGIGKFRGGNFKVWLLRIAANACHDEFRRLQRHPSVPLEDVSLTASDDSFDDHALRRELAQKLKEGLASLSPDQRLAVILCDIQGLSYEEIAQVMGSSVGTVRSRLSRGRARLRDYLARYRELSS